MKILSPLFADLKKFAEEKKGEYQSGAPFPNIVIDNFFDEDFLTRVLNEFPDLSNKQDV